jgi:solute:Na+ symporter, SSS family
MHWIDTLVIVAYLVLTFAVGLHFAARVKTSDDYFLAGRRLPFWAIGMSLVVSDIGAMEMIGGTGAAFSHGVVQANYEWVGCVPAMIVGGLVFVPLFWRLGIHSIPEFLGDRFGGAVRTILAFVWVLFLGAAVGVFFNASAEMFVTVLGWERWFTLLLVAVLVAVYTVGGGLAAVVFTDVIQCVVLFVGGLVLAIVGVMKVGGPGELLSHLPDAHSRLLLSAEENPDFPWTGVVFGLGLVLSPAYWLGNQAIVQRTLGAKSEWDAKASMLFGAFLKTFVPLAFVLPGLLGLLLLDAGAHDDPERVYPRLIQQLLPIGLRGVLYAAFLAALMSSIDSYANSAATIFTRDIYHRVFRGKASHDLIVGRLAALGTIGLGLALAPLSEGNIYQSFQTILAFFQGPSLVLILAGVLWPRANRLGGLTALILGLTTAVIAHFAGMHFLHVALVSFLVSLVGMVAGTLGSSRSRGAAR